MRDFMPTIGVLACILSFVVLILGAIYLQIYRYNECRMQHTALYCLTDR